MVHLRLNEKETNPNPHINFITPLPVGDAAAEEDARQLLRALAAQVRPVMKSHGFSVNSFEEYEYNKVFAGRNWNNGETIEIVLKNAMGLYYPTSWLMSTLCHELAHIKHMNHGPAFQTLWAQLRREVRELQNKGYYGDGYWSSGTRLADSARVGGQGLDPGELPEYMCGGAQSRARPSALRRRRNTRKAGPSNHTGAQTEKKRKAGSRVTSKTAFKGDGKALNEGQEGSGGTGFGKKAGSKRAREERALAAERRLQALLQKPCKICWSNNDYTTILTRIYPASTDKDEESSDNEEIPETDQDRKRTLLESMDQGELDSMKTSCIDLTGDDFIFPIQSNDPGPSRQRRSSPSQTKFAKQKEADISLIEISDDEEPEAAPSCDVKRLRDPNVAATSSSVLNQTGKKSSDSSRPKKKQKTASGPLVMDEMQTRKKEALGMVGPGRTLGSPGPSKSGSLRSTQPTLTESFQRSKDTSPTDLARKEQSDKEWSCLVCTLSNQGQHLACAACGTPRGEKTWQGSTS
ncbi:WLM-domain-containing protein [Panus rudis PR-1116 ss-1]|nr:WLM-domain-containing protein [Panus rudis PR-1116 ss-1]